MKALHVAFEIELRPPEPVQLNIGHGPQLPNRMVERIHHSPRFAHILWTDNHMDVDDRRLAQMLCKGYHACEQSAKGSGITGVHNVHLIELVQLVIDDMRVWS
eukprot:CAMPEP_0117480472 /NCGR_PEP_ID=MMETSP0784-20121206/12408_1 /TAXON_ID=39447 /ORGANISM="" /LENGTH=102 /DNA_ID=CAMNT_0005274911 /DNA_START=864 /DNA_END=1172 /DNA_ORIENTATION=-